MTSTATQQLPEIHRHELQAAIAKAVELRTLHASLLQAQGVGIGANSSPATSSLRLPPGASPSFAATRPSALLSAEDYPVFTPSYEEEHQRGYHHCLSENRALSDTWGGSVLEDDEFKEDDEVHSFIQRLQNKSPSMSREHQQIPFVDDQKSTASSLRKQICILRSSPGPDALRSCRRTESEELRYLTPCNIRKPASLSRDGDGGSQKHAVMAAIPASETQHSRQSQPKSRATILSRIFPRLRKKAKSDMSPNTVESEEISQLFRDWGMYTQLESLKKDLAEAHENRDVALAEVGEMRSSLEELKQKLAHLETYCEELKKALKQAVAQGNESQVHEGHSLARRARSTGLGRDSSMMPVSQEVMVEGFLQVVSEARLSVKQFCKTLIGQIGEAADDGDLIDKLNLLLKQHQLNASTKCSRGVLYHLEALVNQSLHQDFENCVFRKDGAPKILDPQQDRHGNFSAFVALRNLSWNEVLRKGTKYYSEDFSGFCDQKMSCIVSLLDWSRPWPEQLLQAFFVTAKCVWLLHLLAFSFNPPLAILRVDENRGFDPAYMEDMLLERHRGQPPARVKIMVMPGFYVLDRVLKCKVLCRYRS